MSTGVLKRKNPDTGVWEAANTTDAGETFQAVADRNQADGYAGLDSSAEVPYTHLPFDSGTYEKFQAFHAEDYGNVGPNVDSGKAISSALAAGTPVQLPEGNIRVDTPINATEDVRKLGNRIRGAGRNRTTIIGNTGSKPVFDFSGTRLSRLEQLSISSSSDESSPSQLGVMIIRNDSGDSADRMVFEDVNISMRSDSTAFDGRSIGIYNVGSEVMRIDGSCRWDADTGFIAANQNFLGISSDYITVMPEPGTGDGTQTETTTMVTVSSGYVNLSGNRGPMLDLRGAASCDLHGYGQFRALDNGLDSPAADSHAIFQSTGNFNTLDMDVHTSSFPIALRQRGIADGATIHLKFDHVSGNPVIVGDRLDAIDGFQNGSIAVTAKGSDDVPLIDDSDGSEFRFDNMDITLASSPQQSINKTQSGSQMRRNRFTSRLLASITIDNMNNVEDNTLHDSNGLQILDANKRVSVDTALPVTLRREDLVIGSGTPTKELLDSRYPYWSMPGGSNATLNVVQDLLDGVAAYDVWVEWVPTTAEGNDVEFEVFHTEANEGQLLSSSNEASLGTTTVTASTSSNKRVSTRVAVNVNHDDGDWHGLRVARNGSNDTRTDPIGIFKVFLREPS